MTTEKVMIVGKEFICIKADEGKIMTNGETNGYVIYLSHVDDTHNWIEIDDIQPESEEDDN